MYVLFACREVRIAQVLRKTVPEVLSMTRGRRPTHSLDNNIQLVLLLITYIEDITRWRGDMNFMFEWQ